MKIKKKSKEYWENRFLLLEEFTNQISLEAYHQIEKQFYQCQKEVDQKIALWLNRIATNNEISIIEAKKILRGNERKEFQWDLEEYIKRGRQNAVDGKWAKQLENASAKYHISRLEAVKIHIQQANELAFKNQLDLVDQLARRGYEDRYYRTAFELQKGVGIGQKIVSIDQKRLDKIISKPWSPDGENFSDRIWTKKTQMINELHKQLTRTVLFGNSPREAIEHMSQYVNKEYKHAKSSASALVTTEAAYFSSAAQGEMFKELGVEKYQIIATLDTHTSKMCRKADKKVFDRSEYKAGITAPPFHTRCRTTTIPSFDDNFGERAAKGADGKTYYVSNKINFEEWYKEYVESN